MTATATDLCIGTQQLMTIGTTFCIHAIIFGFDTCPTTYLWHKAAVGIVYPSPSPPDSVFTSTYHKHSLR